MSEFEVTISDRQTVGAVDGGVNVIARLMGSRGGFHSCKYVVTEKHDEEGFLVEILVKEVAGSRP